jgi:hypothetical protein
MCTIFAQDFLICNLCSHRRQTGRIEGCRLLKGPDRNSILQKPAATATTTTMEESVDAIPDVRIFVLVEGVVDFVGTFKSSWKGMNYTPENVRLLLPSRKAGTSQRIRQGAFTGTLYFNSFVARNGKLCPGAGNKVFGKILLG